MLLLWISTAVFCLSFGAVLAILIRKFPLVAAIDLKRSHRPDEEKKSSLMEQRLRRKVQGLWSTVQERSKPLVSKTGGLLSGAQKKLVDLEHEYRIRSLPVFLNRRQRQSVNQEIQALLDQAEALMNDGELAAAEEKALQAVRFEPRSVPAFELLGTIYLDQHESGHAKEVYLYLQKLSEETEAIYDHREEKEGQGMDDEALAARRLTYLDRLVGCYQELQDWPAAFQSIQEAVRLEPNNPKFLDRYLDIAIQYGKKSFAEDALEKLQQVNPENTKIPEWQEKIAALDQASSLPTS